MNVRIIQLEPKVGGHSQVVPTLDDDLMVCGDGHEDVDIQQYNEETGEWELVTLLDAGQALQLAEALIEVANPDFELKLVEKVLTRRNR